MALTENDPREAVPSEIYRLHAPCNTFLKELWEEVAGELDHRGNCVRSLCSFFPGALTLGYMWQQLQLSPVAVSVVIVHCEQAPSSPRNLKLCNFLHLTGISEALSAQAE